MSLEGDVNVSVTMSSVSINELPTEILQKTLRYLQPLDLIRCRRVCSRWRDVVDSVVNEEFWHQLCRQDFSSIYKDARLKCHPSLSWHELYKSLHLWAKLDLVDEENWIPICSYSEEEVGVIVFSAIEGKLYVQETYEKIVYYDLKGDKVEEFSTQWNLMSFKETESVIVYFVIGHILPIPALVIIKKNNGEPDLERKVVIGNVMHFAIVGEDVYYKKYDDRCLYFVCKAKDNYESTFVGDLYSDPLAMGCKNDTLNVLLCTYDVFALEKDKFVFKENVEVETARYILNTYNFPYPFPPGRKKFRIS